MASAQALEGSNVEIIATQTANYDRAEGLQVMEDLLQRFGSGEIDAVFTHNDQMSFGAIQAIKEAGREGEIKVFGIDGEAERPGAGPGGRVRRHRRLPARGQGVAYRRREALRRRAASTSASCSTPP